MDTTIRIQLHAVPANDAEHAVDVARTLMLAHVIDAHEYQYECTEIDDDFHDDNPDDPDRFLVTFYRDL